MKRIIAAAAACILISGAAFAQAKAAQGAKGLLTKDETVYALLDPSGAVKSVTVSDWVHGEKASGELRDRSDLSDIENVKGKEVPMRAGNELVWAPAGNDVYYRGTSTKSLPFSVRISYWLDGKRIEPSALGGKSGLVKIRIEVRNLAAAKSQASESGKRVYAPLAVVVGTDLPAAVFRDIEIKGGSIVSDGQNNIVAGVLLPGLMESIEAASSPKAAKGIEDLPDSIKKFVPGDAIEITARATKFSFGSFMIAATPSIPELASFDATGKLQSALDGMSELGEASAAIRSGSAALADGAAKLHDGISTATGAAAPLLQKSPSMDKALGFIQSDEDVAAARGMLALGKKIAPYSSDLKGLLAAVSDPATKKSLDKVLEDAKGINIRALVGSPLLSALVSEDSLASMAEAMKASDELYGGLDDKKLAALADFAAGSGALLSAIGGYDAAAAAYDPQSGLALAALATQRQKLDAVSAKAAGLGSYDAAAVSAALAASSRAQSRFAEDTAFLDEGSAAEALEGKLASGAALTKEERSELAALLSAAKGIRPSAKAGAEAMSLAAKALPILSDATACLPAASAAASAAESLGKGALPALEAAKGSHAATQAALSAAKALDAKSLASLPATARKIGEAKKAYAKNKAAFGIARTFLSIKSRNVGFKAQLAKLDALQKDAAALAPLADKAQALLDSDAGAALLGSDGGSKDELAQAMDDLDRLSKYFSLCDELLAKQNVDKARELVARLPELESGIAQLDSGSAMLAEKLGELASGTAKFDEEGVKKLVSELGGIGNMALGYLQATDKVQAAAKDYRIFTQAPSDAKTSLKFVLRTEEIK
jgi:putative membrane protein